MTVPPVQTDVNVGLTASNTPDKKITYDDTTKTVTVISNTAYVKANVYIAAYENDKLLNVKHKPYDIAEGTTPIVFDDFDSAGADTVKVIIWDKISNLQPLFNPCVVNLGE